jgi:hypothetical protein
MRSQSGIAGVDGLREDLLGPAEIATHPLHDAHVRSQLDAGRIVCRQQRGGA